MRTLAFRFAPYAIVGVLHLVALFTASASLIQLTKPLLMITLLGCFIWALPTPRSRIALFGGLGIVFSWIGDVSLAAPGGTGFLVGLAFFFLAHVAYLVLFLTVIRGRRMLRRTRLIVLPVAVLWWGLFVALLAPHAGALLFPIAIYGAVLGGVAAASFGCNRWIVAGALFFLTSDSLLGLHMFVPDFEFWQVDFTIMLAYIVGQGLIAFGAVQHARTPVERVEAAVAV
jgi:uncharacterized membrane protein YhhN